jgi:hypothetical protein
MPSIREIGRSCTRAHQCTPKHKTALPLQRQTSPSRQNPTLNTATQAPATPALNPHPNNSLLALQHVSLRKNESLHARNMTCKRCSQYGRSAVPARARISAHPNTSLPCPCNHNPPSPSRPNPALNTETQAPATPALNPHANNSLVALQHVSLRCDQFLDTVHVPVLCCNVHR